MYTLSHGGNVDHLLEELHEKKKRLDLIIAGLEAAIESPQHQLIEMASKKFEENSSASTPKVDLIAESGDHLAALARSVGQVRLRRPSRRHRRSLNGKSAAGRTVQASTRE